MLILRGIEKIPGPSGPEIATEQMSAVQARTAGDPSSFAEKTEAGLREKMQLLDAMQREFERTRTSLVPPNPRGDGEVRTVRNDSALDRMQNGILVQIAPGLPTTLDTMALQPNRRAEDEEGEKDDFGQPSLHTMPSILPHGHQASHGEHMPSESQD